MKENYDKFLKVINSLGQYRRAELVDNEQNIIEELYVDPLENNFVFKSMLQNDTTLLIGRKGTGKTTIINRFQHEIRKTNNTLALYIDVKTVFEQAKKSLYPDTTEEKENIGTLEKINLMQFFTSKVIEEIKEEIKKDIFTPRFLSIFLKKMTEDDFENELNAIFSLSENGHYKDASLSLNPHASNQETKSSETEASIGISCTLTTPNIEGKTTNKDKKEQVNAIEQKSKLVRTYNIIEIMNQLKKLLQRVGIIKVFICLDDVSEIDKESIIQFSKSILAPLNNLSDEYFKFKVSLYPGRDFLSEIDRTKVRTFKLDYYDLYKSGNTTENATEAINYTQRIIEKRMQYYFGSSHAFDVFFQIDSRTSRHDYYKLLFEISSNIPRVIGKVLFYAIQKTNGLSKKITKRILQESAESYYNNEIAYILKSNESIEYKSYDEAFDQYHLNKLLQAIVDKAKENKNKIGVSDANIFRNYSTNNAPSHYLYLSSKMEDVLRTLELNFFLSKYSEQKQREGNEISVFVLNYGLCMQNDIIVNNDVDRKFRIERVFDFENLITSWMNSSKRLICTNCNKTYTLDMKNLTDQYGCFECHTKTVNLIPIISEEEKERLFSKIRLPKKEYDVLISLRNNNSVTVSEVGLDLDRSRQSINYSTNKNSTISKMKFIEKIDKKAHERVKISITSAGLDFLRNGSANS